jgi:hypothetical protein
MQIVIGSVTGVALVKKKKNLHQCVNPFSSFFLYKFSQQITLNNQRQPPKKGVPSKVVDLKHEKSINNSKFNCYYLVN